MYRTFPDDHSSKTINSRQFSYKKVCLKHFDPNFCKYFMTLIKKGILNIQFTENIIGIKEGRFKKSLDIRFVILLLKKNFD